jgi:hypothetical protein
VDDVEGAGCDPTFGVETPSAMPEGDMVFVGSNASEPLRISSFLLKSFYTEVARNLTLATCFGTLIPFKLSLSGITGTGLRLTVL